MKGHYTVKENTINIVSNKNQKFGKMLIAISDGHKIGQVDMTFI